MKYETPTIPAQPRERTGSRYAQRLRKAGRLPAIIYGHKTEPMPVSVDEKQVLTHIQHGQHVLNLEIEGTGTETCLVKDLQFGYLGDNVIHVDFTRVDLQEEVTVQVHLNFVGTPPEAHHAGTIVRHDQTELPISCLVSAIPEEIRVDLATMEGLHLTAGEVPLPEGLSLAEDAETIVASVVYLKKHAEETEVGEEAEVEGAAEPEVITEARTDEETTAGDTEKKSDAG